jgi:molybdate transport system substrate-binding protein
MREPKRGLFAVVLFAFFCGFSGQMTAQARSERELKVAAAADLQPVMPALAAGFEKKTGVKLVVSFGSSATLAQQIINGAPFDVFLGADFIFPEKIVAAGLADTPAPVRYAKGTLVLFARKDSPLQPIGIEELTQARVTRVAVADQFHAPFGRAAYAAIDKLKLTDQLKEKLVVAENVAQTAQFVASGNAQMGFISLTLAHSPAMAAVGTYVRVPDVYPEILQYGVAMKKAPHLAEAKQFLDWMLSSEVQEHLTDFGLEPVR